MARVDSLSDTANDIIKQQRESPERSSNSLANLTNVVLTTVDQIAKRTPSQAGTAATQVATGAVVTTPTVSTATAATLPVVLTGSGIIAQAEAPNALPEAMRAAFVVRMQRIGNWTLVAGAVITIIVIVIGASKFAVWAIPQEWVYVMLAFAIVAIVCYILSYFALMGFGKVNLQVRLPDVGLGEQKQELTGEADPPAPNPVAPGAHNEGGDARPGAPRADHGIIGPTGG